MPSRCPESLGSPILQLKSWESKRVPSPWECEDKGQQLGEAPSCSWCRGPLQPGEEANLPPVRLVWKRERSSGVPAGVSAHLRTPQASLTCQVLTPGEQTPQVGAEPRGLWAVGEN